jgi:hypothetical protein
MSEVVVLRGEYFTNSNPNVIICSPNAKSGELVLISSPDSAVMAHIDNAQNIEDLKKLIKKLSKFSSDLKFTIMGRNSDALRGQLTEAIEKFNPLELNQETWSGSHPYNVSLALNGTITVNNSTEASRRYLNEVLFTDNGEARLSRAISGEALQSLAEVIVPKSQIKAQVASKLDQRSNQYEI